MGVPGLLSFLKNNSIVSQKTEITSTRLVIDANNLICQLFFELCTNRDSSQWRCDIYGGDLVAFGEAVEEFFASLDKCKIIPILVFDGSSQGNQCADYQKVSTRKTVYERCLHRFQLAQRITQDIPEDEDLIMPQSIGYIFKSIAHDRGYKKIQASFEADSHVARIANDLDCHVLTNDSDFLMYSLPKGFVMTDSFDYKNIITTKDGRHLIHCSVYSQSRLIRCLPGLRSESMPLLSALLGKRKFGIVTFDCVLEQMLNLHKNTSLLVAESTVHQMIVAILTALRNKTLEKSIEYILSLSPAHRGLLEWTMDSVLPNYQVGEIDNLETWLSEIYPNSEAVKTDRPELLPPAYLLRLLENADLQTMALDMILHDTHYTRTPIDHSKYIKSASCVRNWPFSLAITLLRPSSSDRDPFYVYDREDEDYRKITLRPIEHLDGFGSLEHLNCYSMILLEPERKKSLLMHIFQFNNDELIKMTDILSRVFESHFMIEARTCFILVKYVGLEAECIQIPEFTDALMLTLFYYAAKNGQLKMDSFVDTDYDRLLLRLEPIGRYYEPSKTLYRRIMHCVSQLEAAYLGYCLLNTLLDHAFPSPRYERFFNGPLIFRLTRLLLQGKLEIATLYQKIPALAAACASIKTMTTNRDE